MTEEELCLRWDMVILRSRFDLEENASMSRREVERGLETARFSAMKFEFMAREKLKTLNLVQSEVIQLGDKGVLAELGQLADRLCREIDPLWDEHKKLRYAAVGVDIKFVIPPRAEE